MSTSLADIAAQAGLGSDSIEFITRTLLNGQLLKFLPHVLIACALGFIIGLERQQKHKAAGIRTYTILAGTAAMITCCGVIFTVGPDGNYIGDPTRMAGQIMSAMALFGFAGMVFRKGFGQSGMTSTAMILLALGAGMTCGFGAFGLATVTTLLLVGLVHLTRSSEHAPPVIIVCTPDKVDAVTRKFTKNRQFGGFERIGEDGIVEITLQPELSLQQCEAVLESLMADPGVRKAIFKEVD